jgi:general secretion pathway protein J
MAATQCSAGSRAAHQRGFTLVELLVALTLLALLSAVLSGSLRLAGRSLQGGETRTAQVDDMRQTIAFMRTQIGSMLPRRLSKAVGLPLLFDGSADELRYVGTLPERVAESGTMLFRIALLKDDDTSPLVLERVYLAPDWTEMPRFDDAERTVVAEHVAELKFGYFGRDVGASATDTPTWRDRWDDPQRLPMLIRVDVRPERGPAWPTLIVEPRRAPEAGCRVWDPNANKCLRI